MSGDSIEVNENSNLAQLGQAGLKYGAIIAEASMVQTAVLTQQRSLPAQGGGDSGSSGILGRASSSGASLSSAKGNTEASVYGDMVMSKFAPSLEMAGMGLKLVTKGTDAAAGYGVKTFDQDINSMLKKGPGIHKSDTGASASKNPKIYTGEFNKNVALTGRVAGVCNFTCSPLKGVKSTKTAAAATLQSKLTKTMTAKMANEKNLAITKNLEQGVVGAKVAKAVQRGIAPQTLTHSGPRQGPSFTAPKDEVVAETATDWA